MTTLVPFNPQPTAPFRFSPVLDGVTYSAVVLWNVYGQRYYLNIYTVDGRLMLSTPLIASPNAGYIQRSSEETSEVAVTATTTANTNTLPYTGNISDLITGMTITGNGIPFGTTYTGYSSNAVTQVYSANIYTDSQFSVYLPNDTLTPSSIIGATITGTYLQPSTLITNAAASPTRGFQITMNKSVTTNQNVTGTNVYITPPATQFVLNMSNNSEQSITNNSLTFTFTQKSTLWVPSEDPTASDINLTNGYFGTPIIYRQSSNNFEIG